MKQMKKALLVMMFLFGQLKTFSEPGGCAGPVMSGVFILVDEPIKIIINTKEKIGVIYKFQLENSKRNFDLFIDLTKFRKVKLMKGAKYEITMVHNCLDNSTGFNLMFGKEYDRTNLTMFIRKAK
jgi:hypothetical protein